MPELWNSTDFMDGHYLVTVFKFKYYYLNMKIQNSHIVMSLAKAQNSCLAARFTGATARRARRANKFQYQNLNIQNCFSPL